MSTEETILNVAVGIIASGIYQAVILHTQYEEDGKFPWSDRPKPTGKIMFVFATICKTIAAGFAVWLLIQMKQISGVGGAAIIGMAGEQVIISLAAMGRKGAKHVQATT